MCLQIMENTKVYIIILPCHDLTANKNELKVITNDTVQTIWNNCRDKYIQIIKLWNLLHFLNFCV